MTNVRLIVVGVLAALLASTGCKKSSPAKQKDDHNAAAPMSDDLRGVLAMMARDSEMVAGVDFAALRGTAIYKQHEGQLKGLAASQLELISKLCQFDPTQEMGSVVFAGKGKASNGDMTALVRGLSKSKVMACLTKGAASPPEGFTITVDGDWAMVETAPTKPLAGAGADAGSGSAAPSTLLADKAEEKKEQDQPPEPSDGGVAATTDGGAPAPKRGQSLSLKFLDDSTAVVARRKGLALTGKEIDAVVANASGETIVDSPEFMALIDGTDTDAPVWFVVSGSAPLFKPVKKWIKFDAMWGSVRAGADVDLDVTIRLVDDAEAKNVSSLLIHLFDNLKKSTLRDAVGPSQVTKTDRDVRVTLHESGDQLKQLASSGKELMMALLAGLLGQ